MKRKKAITVILILLVVAVVVFPIRPKHGDRPLMSHDDWRSSAEEVTGLLSAYGARQRGFGYEMVQVNVDQLTGLDGYSLLGVESFFGRRTTTVVGYITAENATQFFHDEDSVWIDVDSIDKLREIANNSEQGVGGQPATPPRVGD